MFSSSVFVFLFFFIADIRVSVKWLSLQNQFEQIKWNKFSDSHLQALGSNSWIH